MRFIRDHVTGDVGLVRIRGDIDRGRCAADLYYGFGAADFKRQIDGRKVAHLDDQAFTLAGPEALRRHRDDVGARRKIGKAVVTARICSLRPCCRPE